MQTFHVDRVPGFEDVARAVASSEHGVFIELGERPGARYLTVVLHDGSLVVELIHFSPYERHTEKVMDRRIYRPMQDGTLAYKALNTDGKAELCKERYTVASAIEHVANEWRYWPRSAA